MLLQMEHNRSLAFTSRTAEARDSASSSLDRRMWNARRCALLLPIPGSFLSSSIRRVIGSAKRDIGICNFVIGKFGNLQTADLGFQIQITEFQDCEIRTFLPVRPTCRLRWIGSSDRLFLRLH